MSKHTIVVDATSNQEAALSHVLTKDGAVSVDAMLLKVIMGQVIEWEKNYDVIKTRADAEAFQAKYDALPPESKVVVDQAIEAEIAKVVEPGEVIVK